jgi:putative iron-regulated protein
MKTTLLTSRALALCVSMTSPVMADGHVTKAAILGHYADIAAAKYDDSLVTASR